jgi:hypothetical protein
VNFFCKDYLNWPITDLIPAGENKHVTSAFMNPPYSNPKPFIEKAWEDSKYCKIVCLVKCDPSTKWWATFWNYRLTECTPCRDNRKHNDDTFNLDECLCEESGPNPGCDYIFFPKRIKFDPPQELIDRGEVWKEKNTWVIKCGSKAMCGHRVNVKPCGLAQCRDCKGKGYKELSGPTFSSALLIFDRREL